MDGEHVVRGRGGQVLGNRERDPGRREPDSVAHVPGVKKLGPGPLGCGRGIQVLGAREQRPGRSE